MFVFLTKSYCRRNSEVNVTKMRMAPQSLLTRVPGATMSTGQEWFVPIWFAYVNGMMCRRMQVGYTTSNQFTTGSTTVSTTPTTTISSQLFWIYYHFSCYTFYSSRVSSLPSYSSPSGSSPTTIPAHTQIATISHHLYFKGGNFCLSLHGNLPTSDVFTQHLAEI